MTHIVDAMIDTMKNHPEFDGSMQFIIASSQTVDDQMMGGLYHHGFTNVRDLIAVLITHAQAIGEQTGAVEVEVKEEHVYRPSQN